MRLKRTIPGKIGARLAFRDVVGGLLTPLAWWTMFLVCAFYGAFAFYMAVLGILGLLGIAEDAPFRAAPIVFVAHAISGGVALISGSLQLNRHLLNRKRELHHVIGRTYIAAVWISSASGLWIATSFDVSMAARIIFGVVATLWFGTTSVALLRILSRKFEEHREWMIRSFSLSLFFITFSLWEPGLESSNLPESIRYPLAVFLGGSLNLIVAGLWIRRSRSHSQELNYF